MSTVEKINLILKKTNISKVNLAKYLGVSRQMVYNYLDGENLSKMPVEKSQLLFKLLEVKSSEEIDQKELTPEYLQSVSNKIFDVFEFLFDFFFHFYYQLLLLKIYEFVIFLAIL